MLREIESSDLEIFYVQQLDPEAIWLAAFVRKDSRGCIPRRQFVISLVPSRLLMHDNATRRITQLSRNHGLQQTSPDVKLAASSRRLSASHATSTN
jgi:hypothetical protein